MSAWEQVRAGEFFGLRLILPSVDSAVADRARAHLLTRLRKPESDGEPGAPPSSSEQITELPGAIVLPFNVFERAGEFFVALPLGVLEQETSKRGLEWSSVTDWFVSVARDLSTPRLLKYGFIGSEDSLLDLDPEHVVPSAEAEPGVLMVDDSGVVMRVRNPGWS